jgi:hypothetical protein
VSARKPAGENAQAVAAVQCNADVAKNVLDGLDAARFNPFARIGAVIEDQHLRACRHEEAGGNYNDVMVGSELFTIDETFARALSEFEHDLVEVVHSVKATIDTLAVVRDGAQ